MRRSRISRIAPARSSPFTRSPRRLRWVRWADQWASESIPNGWGSVPHVVEMQSEGGAAGAVYGAPQTGSLATTFTASQGLLLMNPNMNKIAGELTPVAFHVSPRTVATHALSIFGDHSDVMFCLTTGWAMLCSNSVQEAMDLALIAHAATLETRIPFLHFFDGFRTSDEVNKIEVLNEDDIRALLNMDRIIEHRQRVLSPDHPVLRGTAQNPDVFFQIRETANPYYDAAPAKVQAVMNKFAEACDGTFPTATARWEKRNLALEIPAWDSKICIQCGKCAMVCPHAVIRIKVCDGKELEGSPATFKLCDARDKEWAGMKYTIQVAPEDCTGCGVCVDICPVKNKSEARLKAINMVPQPPLPAPESENWQFLLKIPELDRRKIKVGSIRQQQVQEPLFEFSGACSGCGETPYVKLVSQLFGDRAVVDNATGCSSIYGGNLPTTPWAKNADGRGPAWSIACTNTWPAAKQNRPRRVPPRSPQPQQESRQQISKKRPQQAQTIALTIARVGSLLPPLALLAFAPILFRGWFYFIQPPAPLQVRRLGWAELAHAVAFCVLLIATI
jgi:ferredoxin